MSGMMASLAELNEGLRVRHIAAFPLLTCSASDELAAVLTRPDLVGIDQIPIADEGDFALGSVFSARPFQMEGQTRHLELGQGLEDERAGVRQAEHRSETVERDHGMPPSW